MGASGSQGRRATRGAGGSGWPLVLVVGGGVSGCACAATLATRGVAVTVINSALDTVGAPAYGPDVVTGAGGWGEIRETLAALPAVLRDVWLDAGIAPDNGAGFFAVDRRMLSIETKRALERVTGLQFRQGLVVDARENGSEGEQADRTGGMVLETAFGEVFQGDVVVVAVGLGLGGRVMVGEDVLAGGRYGETPSDGLRWALERLGALWVEAEVTVGPRVGRGTAEAAMARAVSGDNAVVWKVGTVPLRWVLQRGRMAVDWGGSTGRWARRWPDEYPEAPQWLEEYWMEEVAGVGVVGEGATPVLLPDGVATGEVCVSSVSRGWRGVGPVPLMSTRLEHTARGLTVGNLGPGGRLCCSGEDMLPVWVTGRAGGARNYLESLRSGVRVAEDVVRCADQGGALRPDGRRSERR